MIPMGMMKVTGDEVIDMVAMGDCLVTTAGAVPMPHLMPAAAVLGGAGARIGGAHRDGMLVGMIAMGVMEMAIMQVVDMTIMAHGGVAASLAVFVRVVGVL